MTEAAWWRSAVIYQIYPLSFADSDGDGFGDLGGILEHLDYLAGLHVDALWLSPIYRTPLKDYGYDVADFRTIDPLFGATAITNEGGEPDWGFYWSSTTHKSVHNSGGNGVYVAFGRALGYMNGQWLDVHGAGAQRSNIKAATGHLDPSYSTVTDANGDTAIYHGPQGDVVRTDNFVRCVRDF